MPADLFAAALLTVLALLALLRWLRHRAQYGRR